MSARIRVKPSKAKRGAVKQCGATEVKICIVNIETYAVRIHTSTTCALQVERYERERSGATSLLGKGPWPLTLLGCDVNEGRRHDY